MRAKEIHDLALSLFLRGLGIWILFGTVDVVYTAFDWIENALFPLNGNTGQLGAQIFNTLMFLVGRIALAAYFILGAPPFLRWATRDRP